MFYDNDDVGDDDDDDDDDDDEHDVAYDDENKVDVDNFFLSLY